MLFPARSDQEQGVINIVSKGGKIMGGSVYKIIDLVGTSATSWEDAAKNAVETAGRSLKDLRIAEVMKLDLKIDGNNVAQFRTNLRVSFKYSTE